VGFFHSIASYLADHIGTLLAAFSVDIAHRIAHFVADRHHKRKYNLRQFQANAQEEVRIRQLFVQAQRRGRRLQYLSSARFTMAGSLPAARRCSALRGCTSSPTNRYLPQAEWFAGDLIETLPGLLELILETGSSYTPVEKLPVGKLRYRLEQGARKAIAVHVITRGSSPIGYVSIEFKGTDKPANLDAIISDCVYQVNAILLGWGRAD
jgi:hypothetical protein